MCVFKHERERVPLCMKKRSKLSFLILPSKTVVNFVVEGRVFWMKGYIGPHYDKDEGH